MKEKKSNKSKLSRYNVITEKGENWHIKAERLTFANDGIIFHIGDAIIAFTPYTSTLIKK